MEHNFHDHYEGGSDEENRPPLGELPARPPAAMGIYGDQGVLHNGEAAHPSNSTSPPEYTAVYPTERARDLHILLQDLEVMDEGRIYNDLNIQFEEVIKESLLEEGSALLGNINGGRAMVEKYLMYTQRANYQLFQHSYNPNPRLWDDIKMILQSFHELNVMLRQMATNFSNEETWVKNPSHLRHMLLLLGTLVPYLHRVLYELGFCS
ncbi:hypothetical protein FDECE_12007 [Fusarium decemcellulare]|nr:hypothetical protein FDECE_12007 [Fusarium decemcellulare]